MGDGKEENEKESAGLAAQFLLPAVTPALDHASLINIRDLKIR